VVKKKFIERLLIGYNIKKGFYDWLKRLTMKYDSMLNNMASYFTIIVRSTRLKHSFNLANSFSQAFLLIPPSIFATQAP
jgi:hypothetical protein